MLCYLNTLNENVAENRRAGATGKTGTPAIKELRQQGIAVRAMAYKKDERAAALTELARIIHGGHRICARRAGLAGLTAVFRDGFLEKLEVGVRGSFGGTCRLV